MCQNTCGGHGVCDQSTRSVILVENRAQPKLHKNLKERQKTSFYGKTSGFCKCRVCKKNIKFSSFSAEFLFKICLNKLLSSEQFDVTYIVGEPKPCFWLEPKQTLLFNNECLPYVQGVYLPTLLDRDCVQSIRPQERTKL